jgi:hypothetical protein
MQIGVDLRGAAKASRPSSSAGNAITVFGAHTRKRFTPGAPACPGRERVVGTVKEAQPSAMARRAREDRSLRRRLARRGFDHNSRDTVKSA